MLCEGCHGLIHDLSFLHHSNLTKSALSKVRAKGRKTGGDVPYGYRADGDGILKRHEPEQKVILMARSLRAEGLSLRAIGAQLGGIQSRTGRTKWDAQQIARLLR